MNNAQKSREENIRFVLYKWQFFFFTPCNDTDNGMRWHAWNVKLDERNTGG